MYGLEYLKTFRGNKKAAATRPAMQPEGHRPRWIESLEARELLSSTTSGTVPLSDIQGYTPAEIRQAYGFNNVTFDNGSVAADGAGQTIAIVDAYNDPNIASDVKVFDSEFNLPSVNLQIVNQNGGSTLPSTDTGWATEISLDVEWAHAAAPGANILLVETGSASLTDLLGGVNYARNASGVSVVSMSWGGSEFFNWNGGESGSETNYDSYFTTPTGHQGVTFVAAAGDSGAQNGVQWPSASPNVLSVGGTSLTLDSNGNYVSESSWSGTSGGYSVVESEPAYQDSVQSSGARSTPDVSYDGDPNTGFAVYDSLAYQGYSGWQEYGGTSAGSPQWAGLIAIANQGRELSGESTLDGASQTLPMLYSVYDNTSTYNATFNDVVDTTSHNPFHWRFGGYGFGNQATTGYDTATGLGTPKAAGVIKLLAGASSVGTTTGGSTSSGGNTSSGGSTSSGGTTQNLAASPFNVIFTRLPSDSTVAGDSGSVAVQLINTSNSKYSGPVTIHLYASSDTALSSDDTLIGTLTLNKTNVASDGSRTEKVNFAYASDMSSGSYYLVASVATNASTADATAATPTAVSVAARSVDLAATFVASQSLNVNPGKNRAVAIRITNLGNVTAVGTLGVNLYATAGTSLDSFSQLLATMAARRISLKAGKSIVVDLSFTAPEQTGGTYNLLASIDATTQIADSNTSNNIAVIGTQSVA